MVTWKEEAWKVADEGATKSFNQEEGLIVLENFLIGEGIGVGGWSIGTKWWSVGESVKWMTRSLVGIENYQGPKKLMGEEY